MQKGLGKSILHAFLDIHAQEGTRLFKFIWFAGTEYLRYQTFQDAFL